jgi:hypothetical protein
VQRSPELHARASVSCHAVSKSRSLMSPSYLALGPFANLRKESTGRVVSLRWSVSSFPAWHYPAVNGRIFVKFYIGEFYRIHPEKPCLVIIRLKLQELYTENSVLL